MSRGLRLRVARMARRARPYLARVLKRVRGTGKGVRRRVRVLSQGRPLEAMSEWTRVPLQVAASAVDSWRALASYEVPGERRRCPACDAARPVLMFPLQLRGRHDRYKVGFVCGCRSCGLVFANPLPSKEALDLFYSAVGEWGQRRQDEGESTKRPPVAYLRQLFRPVESTLDVTRPPAGARVLDIGCGNGELLDVFQDLGWTTFGIEPAQRAAFRRHHELATIPAEPIFDVVVLHHVLEHVTEPGSLLRAANGALREDGVLVISVPRLDLLSVHRDLRYCINSLTHPIAFTRDGLATLLARAGFAALDVSPPIGVTVSRRYALRRLQMLGIKGPPSVTPPNPLAAGRRAFHEYYRTEPFPLWRRVLPVRMQAALLNRARLRATASRAMSRQTASR